MNPVSTAAQATKLAEEYGVLGVVVVFAAGVIWWLLRERARLHKERDVARRGQQELLRDQMRAEHEKNIALTAQIETMRGIQERITAQKGSCHESGR